RPHPRTFVLAVNLPRNSVSLSAPAGPVAAVVRELRCMCLVITPGIHPKMISNLQVIAAGPQCPKVEAIGYLKSGKEVCLDPEAPLIKKIIQRILWKKEKLIKRKDQAVEKSPSFQ
uniref:Chemokine interleukin-8-like domain-containing protein n=1 Tax=Loxodonta africana TaxID=9785 RepID=G3TJZ3_LOXAF